MEDIKIYGNYDNMPYPIENCDTVVKEPFLTPYLVDNDNDTCMLIFPGGGYHILAEHEGKGYAEYFNSIGISAIVFNYRCCPYQYPCELLDTRRAIRYVKAHADTFGINPEKIVLVGSSAGGHLAAMTACYGDVDVIDKAETHEEIDKIATDVAGIVLCYPVISARNFVEKGSFYNLLGNRIDCRDKLSIEKAAGPSMPPAFIWTTLDDNCVDSRNSLMMATRYKELELDCELHIFPNGNHGMGLAKDHPTAYQWAELCKNWLINRGFLNA